MNQRIDYQDAIAWLQNTMEVFSDEPQWRLDNLQRLVETLAAIDFVVNRKKSPPSPDDPEHYPGYPGIKNQW